MLISPRIRAAMLVAIPILAASASPFLSTHALAAPLRFVVTLNTDAPPHPTSGRLVVFLIKDGASLPPTAPPINGPFWSDPQPLFGMNFKVPARGESVTLDDAATAFPAKPSELPPGTYRAQAALILNRPTSDWKDAAGNLTSDIVTFTIKPEHAGETSVALSLKDVTTGEEPKAPDGVEWFSVKSELLSAFRGEDVLLRAGVVLPRHYDPKRSYPAVYEVPGFGGRHYAAARIQGRLHAAQPGSPAATLAENIFWIVLDPESPNGHTLFVDSDNNGPCGRALTEELLPALEAKYPLIRKPEARLLRGHSSGGWSTIWLAITYPYLFGAAWSSSPDPVDFRKFQLTDLYTDPNMYVGADGLDLSSYRAQGKSLMTVRQENLGEEVLGPDNTSGQQWDSWMAVAGPKNERSHPAALYDPGSGRLDHAIADHFHRFDIGHLLRTQRVTIAPLLRSRVRLVVGDQDSFYLNEAVALLKADLDTTPGLDSGPGYIKILPGFDHGSIYASEEIRNFPREMLDHLRSAEILPPDPAPAPQIPAMTPLRKEH